MVSESAAEITAIVDPRAMLADWANRSDEWSRLIVRTVLTTGRQLDDDAIDQAYALLRQEKSLDERCLPVEAPIELQASVDEAEPPLLITRISDVQGVNALVSGAVIEPHVGLTILFGENGTGKTGYARILKSLADSRTADEILGNIATADTNAEQSATIDYKIGDADHSLAWAGERGKAPFTRMSIFDSPAVYYHVDDDLEYVYVPAALALFSHVINGIKAVQDRINTTISELTSGSTSLLVRFSRESSVYPLIETLGAATDLEELRAKADDGEDVHNRIDALRMAVASLESDTIAVHVKLAEHADRVLRQAHSVATTLRAFDQAAYNSEVAKKTTLEADYRAFRSELFAAADLPAEPDSTWDAFVAAGGAYRSHLSEVDAHDADRCLYCRQTLNDAARGLVSKYSDYLQDEISADISATREKIDELAKAVRTADMADVSAFIGEYAERGDRPEYYSDLHTLQAIHTNVRQAIEAEQAIGGNADARPSEISDRLQAMSARATEDLASLREQQRNRVTSLTSKKNELTELEAAAELAISWPSIESQVREAKEADRLKLLKNALPGLSRNLTALSKTASDRLINESFDKLFEEECAALRTPSLKLQFVGRQGKAQRRKALSGYKPSKVLSEGEQKVLAMADFLAESRLAGITAPVIFDDPVSSLDHRRINEVARRIALLAESNQVIVFTHDIFFATTLLVLFEKSKRCAYFQVTDDGGKGKVNRASGPRWDNLKGITKNIKAAIEAARKESGDTRAALICTGYNWIRSWCEVFTELELLQGVTQRYQPNVRMTVLPQIKTGALPDAISIVTRIFEDACRYIDGHSQPLPTLGVSPTLTTLEDHWKELEDCRDSFLKAAN